MKKALLVIIFGILFCIPALAEKIDNFDVEIKINNDSSIDVTERIEYDFGDLQKHGMFRELPAVYKEHLLLIDDVEVEKENGEPWEFTYYKEGRYLIVKIGSASEYVSGRQVFIIKYHVEQAIGYFEDYDELYWNASGDEWQIPIMKATAKVYLPRTIKKDEAKLACFAGYAGSVSECNEKKIITNSEGVEGYYFSQDSLAVYQGLTVVAKLNKGDVAELDNMVTPDEEIIDLDVRIDINPDSSLKIRELIDYNFGIYEPYSVAKEIPTRRSLDFGDHVYKINNIEVKDRAGLPFVFESRSLYENEEIFINHDDGVFAGREIIDLNYDVSRAFLYGQSNDNLTWLITGKGWGSPIRNVNARLYLPEGIERENLQINCSRHTYDALDECESVEYISNDNGKINEIIINEKAIETYGDFEISLSLPKGVVSEPGYFEKFIIYLFDNWMLLVSIILPVFIFIFIFRHWYIRGRDPEGRGTIIAQFDQPDNLGPAQVGAIIDEYANKKDISAEIIYLATRGYLKIVRLKDKKNFTEEDFLLVKKKDDESDLNPYQKKIFDILFKTSASKSEIKKVKKTLIESGKTLSEVSGVVGADNQDSLKDFSLLSDSKTNFYKGLSDIMFDIYESAVTAKYFFKNPKKVRSSYLGFGILSFVLAFSLGITLPFLFFALLTAGVLLVFFSRIMPKRTMKGVLAREYILGLKKYIKVAEIDRMKFHNAPEKSPEHFEALLPFAIVLGLEKEWARQFKDIYEGEPEWYSSDSSFTASSLIGSLNSFSQVASSAVNYSPAPSGGSYSSTIFSSSSSSGSSGFSSSGGSSGGGFGGGGGGSW